MNPSKYTTLEAKLGLVTGTKSFALPNMEQALERDVLLLLFMFIVSDGVISITGFIYGFVVALPHYKGDYSSFSAFWREPLSSLFGAALWGIIHGFGAGFVAMFIPKLFRWIVPLVCMVGAVRHLLGK